MKYASSGRRDADAHRHIVLASICASGILIPIVFSGPAIALPDIARHLPGDVFTLSWIVNAYNVAFGSLVMAGGALADQVGRRRCFLFGLVLFLLTSLLIVFTPSLTILIALRAIEGLGGALTLTAGASLITQAFEGHARTRAFSLLGTSFGIGLAFGPLTTGIIVSTWGWRALFLAIAIASLLILVVVFNNLEESRNPDARGVDLAGTITFTAALAVIIFSIVQGPHFGWGSGITVGLLGVGCLLLLLFVAVELRIRAPMLDLSLFRHARFLGVLLLPVVTGFSFIALLVYLPIWFIGIKGYDAFHAGLAILPLTAPMLVVPFLSGVLSKHFSPASLCSAGLALAAVGVFGLSRLTPGSAFVDVALPMLVIGIGNGVPWGLMDSLAMNAIPKERAGMAAGIFSTMRVTGEAIAIAVIGAALIGLTHASLASVPAIGTESAAALTNSITSGNMGEPLRGLSPVVREVWVTASVNAYAAALKTVLSAIAILALISAWVLWLTLRRPAPVELSMRASKSGLDG